MISGEIVLSRLGGGVCVTDIVSSRCDWLDLLGVYITVTFDDDRSYIWLLLDNESLTVVQILH
jgi:hypothetical protein